MFSEEDTFVYDNESFDYWWAFQAALDNELAADDMTSKRIVGSPSKNMRMPVLIIAVSVIGVLALAWMVYRAFKGRSAQPVDIPLHPVESNSETQMRFLLSNRAAQEICDMSFKFTSRCTVQTNFPIPSEDSYFELMVLALPRDAELSVGLSDSRRLSSTDPSSYGQSSAVLDVVRRRLFRNGVDCGPALTASEGDIIGCNIRASPPSLTFSSNGISCVPISISMNTSLYPTISGTQGCCIKYNFGSDDFVYGPDANPTIPPVGLLPKYEDVGHRLPEYE